MFDQQTTPQSLPPQSPIPPQSRPPVVEDMFARSDANASPVASQNAAPVSSSYGFNPVPPTGMPPINEQELFGGRSFGWGKVIAIIISMIVLIALGVGGWFGYRYMIGQRSDTAPVAPVVNNENPTPATPSIPNQEPVEPTTPVEPLVVVDSDSDGLSDEEEQRLGTNSERADTDIDGLIDRAEIQVYKTDPLKADTDGDGYLDGDEVINGFDPLIPGSARLIQVPQN